MIEEPSNTLKVKYIYPRIYLAAIFLLSSASLCYEINITRLFSVTQFYHFAFLIVSLALLGYGTSGGFLALFPGVRNKDIGYVLTLCSVLTAISFLFAYLLTNYIPFDSFSVTLGWQHVGVLLLHMVALTTPFFFSGLSVILLISHFAEQTNLIYGVNFGGSALGCLVALLLPSIIGAEGLVVVCTLLAVISSFLLFYKPAKAHSNSALVVSILKITSIVLFVFCSIDLYIRVYKGTGLDVMKLKISPYKAISYALQYPGSEIIFQEWNAYSRVDLIQSDGIRSYPGYSYMSDAIPPKQNGLYIDGDDLSPVVRTNEIVPTFSYMPTSVVYLLRPNPEVLILEPHGGLEIVIAHSEGAQKIFAAEPNPLVIDSAQNLYDQEYVVYYLESGRSYLRRSNELYDVIVISLNSSFHPVRSGAYSLGEDYRYTIEAFEEALLHLKDDGFLILTRWLQTPPSEFLKAFSIAIEAVVNTGGNPERDIAAFRSYNTGTLIIKRGDLTSTEIKVIKDFTASRAFDNVYYPEIQEKDVNKYNVLPEPYYSRAFLSLLFADSRNEWYGKYPYNVAPPSDDQPFFNQFFKWSQLPNVVAEYGKVWEPFGGAGFVILLLLLILTIILSLSFIIIPTIISIKSKTYVKSYIGKLIYFAAIGLAFMFLEIPMIQHFILFLDNPSYSMTTVLFALLLFSGLGSRFSKLFSINTVISCLLFIGLMNIFFLKQIMYYGLGLPLFLRIVITILLLAPVGFFMGMPFPKGIEIISTIEEKLVPWAWGVNGAFSVMAGVTAALIAISYGFKVVFIVGSALYLVAWFFIRELSPQTQHHHQ